MKDPWAQFADAPLSAPAADPWAQFSDAPRAAPVGVGEDVARAVPSGVARGVSGTLGLPGLIDDWVTGPIASAPARLYNRVLGDGTYSSPPGFEAARRGLRDLLSPPTPERIQGALESIPVVGPHLAYKPQTVPGQYAGTLAEFAVGAPFTGGAGPVGRAAQVVVPALLSETAGQATKGTAAEPYARAAGALTGGIGTAIAQRPSAPLRALEAAAQGLDDATVTAARGLIDDAAGQGVTLTWPEALNQVTGGRFSRLAGVQHVLENTEEGANVLAPIMARRAAAIQGAGDRAIGGLADNALDPYATGTRTEAAARAAMAATPEGTALTETVARNAPRTTADDAGAVIQPSLRGVYDQRVAQRAAVSDPLYTAARATPPEVPVEGVTGPGTRTVTVRGTREELAPDFPIDLPERRPPAPTGAAPAATGPRAESLAEFIARNGGIQLDADFAHAGLDAFNVPFVGKVVRPDGRNLDEFWRPKLMEAGFLRPDADGYFSRSVRDEVIDLLRREQAGSRVVREGQEGQIGARAAARRTDEETYRLAQARHQIEQELEAAGVPARGLNSEALDAAAEALAQGRDDYLDVLERAGMAREADEWTRPTRTVPTEEKRTLAQVDPRPVVSAIDQALELAKGPARDALRAARRALHREDGALEPSVEGLHNAREALGDLISGAKIQGANRAASNLLGVQRALDAALETAPAYATARRTFAEASEPLRPFGDNRVPGKIVARDEFERDFTMPREQAAPAVERGGASAARDFAEVAPGDARGAFENYLATRLLDGATDGSGNINADGLRRALLDNEDTLRQFPAVTRRVEEIVAARRGMAPVERSPLGQVASQQQVMDQARALLPNQPTAGIDAAVSQTVRRVVAQDPDAAQNLVRIYAQTVFDEAVQSLASGQNAFGGAKFSAVIVGNPQQARNLEAAVRALPNGQARWDGFRRFLDIAEATGQRVAGGSRTAFNQEIRQRLEGTGVGQAAASLGMAAGVGASTGVPMAAGIPARLGKWFDGVRAGQNSEALARIFTDPAADGLLRQIAREPPTSAKAQALALRLTFLVDRASAEGSRQAVGTPRQERR